ncbi:MAG: hypothetical protein E7645_08465, partial [Ruminococcaceae bacterium]|nr:hypothetical protein [Oscillospiraceae bacterium]
DYYHIDVRSWASVTTIACGKSHAAALLSNGQVLASGDNRQGQCDTSEWQDMADVCCGLDFTVGLKQDGSLLLAGGNKSLRHTLEKWQQIAGLFTDEEGREVYAVTFGEGRLLSTAALPGMTRKWRNLVYVAVSPRGIVGITATGRLLSTHRGDQKQLDELGKDYITCAMGDSHMAALSRSGEVIALGHNDFGQCATARFGRLFKNFEGFYKARNQESKEKIRLEKQYQQRFSETSRFARRLACGERLTACLQVDGRVNATAGLRRVKGWENVCALSCGSAHILALHTDGSVSADGNNVGGCCRVGDWRGVKEILARKYHSLGLCYDGSVLFTGWDVYHQGRVNDWKDIYLLRSSDTYTVGVSRDGKLHFSGKHFPFDPEVLDLSEWSDLKDLAVSEHHMVGLTRDGRVIAVGDSFCGQPDAKSRLTETSTWRGVRAISVGDGFTVGLCYGGRVLAAGNNTYGQCETSLWKNVVLVKCGRSFTAALTTDGQVLTAGCHKSGAGQMITSDEIGTAVMDWEKAEATGYEPFSTQWMTNVLTLDCGQDYLVAVDRGGHIMADGLDLDGQCTAASSFLLFRDIRQLDGFGVYNAPVPAAVPTVPVHSASEEEESGKSKYKSDKPNIAVTGRAGYRQAAKPWHVLARELLGQVSLELSRCIYISERRVLKAIDTVRHTECESLSHGQFSWIASGAYHTMAVTSEGQMMSFGAVPAGQGITELSAVSETLDGQAHPAWSSVACGPCHTAAIRADGRVVSVGQNDAGQCNTEAWEKMSMVACGAAHTVGLDQAGHAMAIGDNTCGQCGVSDWPVLAMVACGEKHTVGLRMNGTVLAVGEDSLGQCRVNKAKDIISVACLPEATLCVRKDGRVEIYGGTGELKERISELRQVVAVYTCEYRLCALTSDGRIIEVR